jgi:hypothetical protein
MRFVSRRLLLVVFLHLGMGQIDQRLLMVLEHVQHFVLVLEVGPEMRHDLAGQFVEQTRVVVVTDVVEINEAAHEVVFELLLRHNAGAAHEPMLFPSVQFLDENLVIHRLKANAGKVEIELPVSPRHIAHRLDRDARNVNRKLVPQGYGLGHDLGHVHLLGDAVSPAGGGDGLLTFSTICFLISGLVRRRSEADVRIPANDSSVAFAASCSLGTEQ